MTTLVNEFRATYAFMERNANLVKRYWSWELVWIVYSIANSLSVSFIGLGMEQMGGVSQVDGRYLVLYLVVGTLVWRYLSLIFYWITDVIGMERWEGTIEYTLMAPIRRVTHMAGQTIWAVIYSMFSTSYHPGSDRGNLPHRSKQSESVGRDSHAVSRKPILHRCGRDGLCLATALPGARFADDACHHRPPTACVGCVLSGGSAARVSTEAGSLQPRNLRVGWHPASFIGRHPHSTALAVYLANIVDGIGCHPGGIMGVWFGRTLCQAQRQAAPEWVMNYKWALHGWLSWKSNIAHTTVKA